MAPGSTVALAAGEYAFTQPLVLLDGVTLRGAAKGTTVIRSSAPDAAVVVLTGARVDLADFSLVLDTTVSSSGVVAGPAASVDGANARRQAGSTLKPHLYAQVIEHGWLTAASGVAVSVVATGYGILSSQVAAIALIACVLPGERRGNSQTAGGKSPPGRDGDGA